MPKILVTGMSGTGKTSALDALSRLGYRVVDTDDAGWRDYHRDPASTDPVHRGVFVWNEDRMSALLGSDDPRTLFVAGCVNNQADFYDRFDAVVLLSAPARVILDRVAARTTNPYGKSEVERAMILDDLANVEPRLRARDPRAGRHSTVRRHRRRPRRDRRAAPGAKLAPSWYQITGRRPSRLHSDLGQRHRNRGRAVSQAPNRIRTAGAPTRSWPARSSPDSTGPPASAA